MNPESTEKLLTAYPLLYRKLREWGFECGDGWFDLIWQVSTEIESAAHLEGIPQTPGAWPSVRILKQKAGTLRVQFDKRVSDPIEALVTKVNERSMETCELCGAPGQYDREQKQSGWAEVLCDQCHTTYRLPRVAQDETRPLPVWMQERSNHSK